MEVMQLEQKPIMSMTPDEQAKSLELIQSLLDQGKVVILGYNCCACCGREIGEAIGYDKDGEGTPRLVVNLCDRCRKLVGWGDPPTTPPLDLYTIM